MCTQIFFAYTHAHICNNSSSKLNNIIYYIVISNKFSRFPNRLRHQNCVRIVQDGNASIKKHYKQARNLVYFIAPKCKSFFFVVLNMSSFIPKKSICREFYCTILFKNNLQLKYIEFLLRPWRPCSIGNNM